MSAERLAELSFPAFMIAIGLLQLLLPFERAKDSAMRRNEMVCGFCGLLLGLLYLLRPLDILHERAYLFSGGVFALGCAFYTLVVEPRFEAWRQQRYEAELSRLALSTEYYSESLRAFHASSPFAIHPRRRWAGGGILILFGTTWLVLALIVTR